MTEIFKNNISQHITLSEDESAQFYSLFQKKTIKKRQFLLREGEICKFEGFVIKGLFKTYHIDSDGIEQILNFATED
jgi:CRP-like cAMP-binding protein